MHKASVLKIGAVTVKEVSPRHWLLSYVDPITKKEVRRQVSDMSLPEVQQMAGHISYKVLADKGYVPGPGFSPRAMKT
jgi:hypothetical protein